MPAKRRKGTRAADGARIKEESDVGSDDSLFNSSDKEEEEAVDADGQTTFEVERILAEKEDPKFGFLFLTKWAGYPIKDCTWEPIDSFCDKNMVNEWRLRKRRGDPGTNFDWKAWDKDRQLSAEEKEAEEEEEEEESDDDMTDTDPEPSTAATRFIRGQVRRPKAATRVRKRVERPTRQAAVRNTGSKLDRNLPGFVVPDHVVDDDDEYSGSDESTSEDEEPDPEDISTDLGSSSDSSAPKRRRKSLPSPKSKKQQKALEKIRARSPTSKAKLKEKEAAKAKEKEKKAREKERKAKEKEKAKAAKKAKAKAESVKATKAAAAQSKKAEAPAPPQTKRPLPQPIPFVQEETPRRRSAAEDDSRLYTTASIMRRAELKGRRELPPEADKLILFKPGERPQVRPSQMSPIEPLDERMESPPPPDTAPAPVPPKKKISLAQYKERAGLNMLPIPQPLTLKNLPTMRRKSAAAALATPAVAVEGTLYGDGPITANSPEEMSPLTGTAPAPAPELSYKKGAHYDSLTERLPGALARGPIEVKMHLGSSSEYVGRLRFLEPSPEFRKFWSRLGEESLTVQTPLSRAHLPYFVQDYGGPEEWFDIELKAVNENIVKLLQIVDIHDSLIVRNKFWHLIIFSCGNSAFNKFFDLPPVSPTTNAQYRGVFFYVGRDESCIFPPHEKALDRFEHDTGHFLRVCSDLDVAKVLYGLDDPTKKCAVIFITSHPILCSPGLQEMRDAFSGLDCEEVPLEDLEDYYKSKANISTAYTVMVHWTVVTKIHKLALLQIVRKSLDAQFFIWGARPRLLSEDDLTLGIDLYTERVIPFWRSGIVFYVSWEACLRSPESFIMIQDFVKRSRTATKIMVAADFPRLLEQELMLKKDQPTSQTGLLLAMAYADSPWNNAIGFTPYHDERYHRIRGLTVGSGSEKTSEQFKKAAEVEMEHFAREVGSKKIYPYFNRFIFLDSGSISKRHRDKFPALEFHSPDSISAITKLPVESRQSILRRLDREYEHKRLDEAHRQSCIERGGEYFSEREMADIRSETQRLLDVEIEEAFAGDPEEEYYFDAL